jgi:small subunit ribosomal protein S8
MTDPISDMLIRIKNAQLVKKDTVSFGYSILKMEIIKVLEKKGFLSGVERRGKKQRKLIEAQLIYAKDGSPKINGIKRVSKPSRRIYTGFREVYSVKNGIGMALYSTTKGILTDKEARKEKVGGENLFEIW